MSKSQITNENVGLDQETAFKPQRSFDENIKHLERFGGFKLLETTIEGVDNLNPERRAKKTIFLTEEGRKEDRDAVKNRLELWKALLSQENSSAIDLLGSIEERQTKAQELFNRNLHQIVEATREYESTYRGIMLFFENGKTSGMKIRNAVFMDTKIDQLDATKITNKITIDHIYNEIHRAYNRFDLAESYSLMVVPGFLKNKVSVSKWAGIANEHRLMFITDYRNMDSLKDILTQFKLDKLASDTPENANILMACNHIVGRGKYDEIKELEDLYVEPSSALAGKIYSTLVSQVSAGYEHGHIKDSSGVRHDLLKTEVGELEGMGLVPLTFDWGKVQAMSGKTLYTGNNLGLKTYSVVRVFDWIMKVLMQFLNKRAMQNWDSNVQQEIQREIVQFLDKIKGPGKIIEKFEAPQFVRDPIQKDRIYLNIHITPFFPAKTFVIGLTGEDGRDADTGRRKDFSGEVNQK